MENRETTWLWKRISCSSFIAVKSWFFTHVIKVRELNHKWNSEGSRGGLDGHWQYPGIEDCAVSIRREKAALSPLTDNLYCSGNAPKISRYSDVDESTPMFCLKYLIYEMDSSIKIFHYKSGKLTTNLIYIKQNKTLEIKANTTGRCYTWMHVIHLIHPKVGVTEGRRFLGMSRQTKYK